VGLVDILYFSDIYRYKLFFMPRKDKKYHYLYKTTNLKTGKFYFGIHSTDNIDDGYIGSGKKLWYSINKYGKENHKKDILEFVERRDLLNEIEIKIINEFINNPLCMNLSNGGFGFNMNHQDETKMKISTFFSGKTYEQIHGIDKADTERKKRSVSVKNVWDSLSEEEKKDRIKNATDKRNEFYKKNHTKRFGKPSVHLFKEISQFSINGEFIRDWSSINQAAEFMNVDCRRISDNLRGKKKMVKGFIFKYK
jgi:hypothetical protein